MDSQYSEENSMESHTEDDNSITTEERDENSSERNGSEEEQSSITTKNSSEEEIDPWATLINDATSMVRAQYDDILQSFPIEGHDESEAKQEAFEKILPVFQKELGNVYMDNLAWMEQVTHVTDLGITISNDLSWSKHTEITAAKANKTQGLIKRICRDIKA